MIVCIYTNPSLTVSADFQDRDPEFMRVYEIDFRQFPKFAGFVVFEARKPFLLLAQFDFRNCQTSANRKKAAKLMCEKLTDDQLVKWTLGGNISAFDTLSKGIAV